MNETAKPFKKEINVKNLYVQKCALSLFMLFFCLTSRNQALSADQVKTTVSKKPALEKKQQTETKSEKQPKIVIEANEYDVGSIYEGMPAKHDFKVKNNGEGDLLINRVKAG